MRLRYVIARLVPDLIREEPINVGIILQSDEWIGSKFLEKIPKSWGLGEDLKADVANNLDEVWKERLDTQSEVVYLPDAHELKTVPQSDRIFLEWLRRTYTMHLRFSDIREADIDAVSGFDFDTFLSRLYGIFVSPKPIPRKRAMGTRLHTKVKKEFKQLQLPTDHQIREKDVIVGTFPWPIDFVYSINGYGRNEKKEVAIGLVDFNSVRFKEKAKDLIATWADVRSIRRDEVKRFSVVGNVVPIDDHKLAIEMIERFSTELFRFESDKNRLLDLVVDDLKPF